MDRLGSIGTRQSTGGIDSPPAVDEKGIQTLTGTVSEESHKALAEQTVSSLPGVIRVDNQLATKAEVAADNADTWIGRKVKLALLFHRNVNAAEKSRVTKLVSDIPGVTEVNNEMTVEVTMTR